MIRSRGDLATAVVYGAHGTVQPSMDHLSFGLTLPATASSVSLVRFLVGGVRPMWPLSDLLMDDIQIALSEACASVVQRAQEEGTPGMLEVAGTCDGESVVLRVRDSGPRRGPTADVASAGGGPPGAGLALVAALATRIEVGHAPDGTHELAMTFALTDEAGAP